MTQRHPLRVLIVGATALLGLAVLVGCGSTEDTSSGGGPTVVSTVTAPPSTTTSKAPDCSAVPEITSPVALNTSNSYFHLAKTVQSGGDSCFGFRVYDGMIGDKSQGAGTGASAVQLLVVFVDGQPVNDPPSHLVKGVRVVKSSGAQIDVQFDMRERGIDPESWVDATYRKTGSAVQAEGLPDFGSRFSVTSLLTSGSSPTAPTSGTVPLDKFRMGEQFAFRSPTGAIVCVSRGTSLRCETRAKHQVPVDVTCGIYDTKYESTVANVVLWKDGAACATILQGIYATADGILQYGESVTVPVPGGDLTCASSETGFRCVGADGKGFMLSRERLERI